MKIFFAILFSICGLSVCASTVTHSLVLAVHPVFSADSLTPINGGSTGRLVTIAGVWTFENFQHPSGNWSIQLNGTNQNPNTTDATSAVQMYVLNGGVLYQMTQAGAWFSWTGAGPWMGPVTDPRTVSPPAAAVAAGLTTLAWNFDFSQSQYADTNPALDPNTNANQSWLDCSNGTLAPSRQWHLGQPGETQTKPCDIHQAVDPVTGKTVLMIRNRMSYGNAFPALVGMQTHRESDVVNTLDIGNFYRETRMRIAATFPNNPCVPIVAGCGTSIASAWHWNATTMELDNGELNVDQNGYGDSAIHNHGNGNNPDTLIWVSYDSTKNGNLPPGWVPTASHNYAAMLTSDGATATYYCTLVDNILQKSCINAQATASQFTSRNWLVETMEMGTPVPPIDLVFYVEYDRGWSCANWQTQMCNGAAPLSNNGTLVYWPQPPPPAPAYLSAVPAAIPNGGSAVLTWDSTAVGSCAGTGFSTGGAVSGSLTVAPTTTTTYSVNCGGNSASAIVTVSGTQRDAAASFCAANGGGNGSTGSPWQAACIQAAINASANGDTVFLAAGNWELKISQARVITGNKRVNLTGAGSGNTFDYLGHPNNPTGGPVGTTTRVFTSGTNGQGGGYIVYGNYDSFGSVGCSGANPGPLIQHIYIDGSISQSQASFGEFGDYNGTLNLQSCDNATINDIRVLQCCTSVPPPSPNTQFWVRDSANVSILNSIFTLPVSGGSYSSGQVLQLQEQDSFLIRNNIFYQNGFNPIYTDHVTYESNLQFTGCDGISCDGTIGQFGLSGCSISGCSWNGSLLQSSHFIVRNNYFHAPGGVGNSMGLGAGVNDPGSTGRVADLQYLGNWVDGDLVAIDGCQQHIYGGCQSNVVASGEEGMNVNGMTVTNNSLIGLHESHLNATGTGCTTQGTGANCPSSSLPNMQVINFNATQNYLQGPSNQYNHDAQTITPSVSNNFCSGSTFSGCTTTGFTTLPTVAFSLGTLSNGVIQFNQPPTFTAQYGAVKWLASTSSTTPTSGDARWSFLPPQSLAVTHGSTVFMWVMDSANNISAPASAAIP